MSKERPLILVSNDDGISAPGIRYLIRLMKKLGDVFVVAPNSPQSGMSHAITLESMLFSERVQYRRTWCYRVCLLWYTC